MTNQIADYRLTCNPDQTHTEDQSAKFGDRNAQVLWVQDNKDIHSMSHNEAAHKIDEIAPRAVSRAEFLAALYEKADPALWLEIRCIHPVTDAVRVRWTPLGDRRRLANNLHQADAFNREGYDELFAPCLRGERKGTAEAAVLVPTLWVDVDCDDDPARRSAALNTLHTFEPVPSIILDSGGGWHVYWLLDEPVPLPDDAAREHIANILQGLFDAVGGDVEYSKSVASLLRKFLKEKEADDVLPGWQDVIFETAQAVRQERASEVFLDLLDQLLVGGQVMLDDDMRNLREPVPGKVKVRYRDGGYVYLLPEIAHREICKVQPLRFSTTAIGAQLKEKGRLLPGCNTLTVQRRVQWGTSRF